MLKAFVPAFTLIVLLQASSAHAQPTAPTTRASAYSPYEQESIRDALASFKGQLDPDPDHKTIEDIEIVRLEVIEKRDPVPGIVNYLHTTTRPYIIERELLFRKGEPYSQTLVDETARNLRQYPQLSLVLCLPVRGSDPSKIRVLVITKDVWSLRLNWDVAYGAGGLEQLTLNPSETNLAGTHHQVATQLVLNPSSYSLGASHSNPRLFGSHVGIASSLGIIANRNSGSAEGSYGSVSVSQPLWSTLTDSGFSTVVGWRTEIYRRYVNAQPTVFNSAVTKDLADNIPYEYRSRTRYFGATYTRSFGWAVKNDISTGIEGSFRYYGLEFDTSKYSPDAIADFVQKKVPRSDDAVAPFIQYRAYTTNFSRILDFETLALQEDYRLGHDLYLRVYPATQALGSSRDFVGVFASAQYTVPLSDGLARISLKSTTEATKDSLPDASIEASSRLVSPRLGFGRIVFDAYALNRYRNYLNRHTVLGGNTRLRGYPSSNFDGANALVFNLEFRSRPAELFGCQVAGAGFWDAGNAFDSFSSIVPHQSLGLGLRALFPQLDRAVFRADLGFPVGSGAKLPGVTPASFFFAFEQAFSMPSPAPPALYNR
jgi:hypothetical protein